MSEQRFLVASVSLLLCTLVALTTSSGQESGSLPDLGVDMTSGRKDGPSMPVTPAIIERGNVFKVDGLELQYLLPLQWELEKYRIYQDLMRLELDGLAIERDQAVAERKDLISELTINGTTSLEQLEEKYVSLQEARLQSAILEAESAALRDAIEQRKASIAGQGRKKFDEAIDLQKKLVEFAERKKQEVARLHRGDVVSASQLLEADAEAIRARRELALMEAEAFQQSDPILDAILSRLAEIEPQRKATAAKMETLSELTEKSAQIRQLIDESKQTERKLDLLEERKHQLTTRLREQKLRADYLARILQRYEESLKKVTSSSQEKRDE